MLRSHLLLQEERRNQRKNRRRKRKRRVKNLKKKRTMIESTTQTERAKSLSVFFLQRFVTQEGIIKKPRAMICVFTQSFCKQTECICSCLLFLLLLSLLLSADFLFVVKASLWVFNLNLNSDPLSVDSLELASEGQQHLQLFHRQRNAQVSQIITLTPNLPFGCPPAKQEERSTEGKRERGKLHLQSRLARATQGMKSLLNTRKERGQEREGEILSKVWQKRETRCIWKGTKVWKLHRTREDDDAAAPDVKPDFPRLLFVSLQETTCGPQGTQSAGEKSLSFLVIRCTRGSTTLCSKRGRDDYEKAGGRRGNLTFRYSETRRTPGYAINGKEQEKIW